MSDLNKISLDFINFVNDKYKAWIFHGETIKSETIEGQRKVRVFASGYYGITRELGVEDLPEPFVR